MKLTINPKADNWFKTEVGLAQGAGIRILVKVYGHSPISEGFSLAIEPNYPSQPSVTLTSPQGILFYIEEKDEWFFDGHDLYIDYNETLAEPAYVFIKDGKAIN